MSDQPVAFQLPTNFDSSEESLIDGESVLAQALVRSGIQFNMEAVKGLVWLRFALGDGADTLIEDVVKYKAHQQPGYAKIIVAGLDALALRIMHSKQQINTGGGNR